MKRFSKMFEMFIIFVGLVVILSCSNQVQDISSDITYDFSSDGEPIDVIILAGQSNATGSCLNEGLKNYVTSEEYALFTRGFENQKIIWYLDWSNYSMPPVSEQLTNVKMGQGLPGIGFGPEIGISYVLNKNNKEVVIIKVTSPGSGIGTFVNDNGLAPFFELFIFNSMKELNDKGYSPKIKCMCWMQGERDSSSVCLAFNYEKNEELLVSEIRNKFGKEIVFINAKITDWELVSSPCYQNIVNDAKIKNVNKDIHNYMINSDGLRKQVYDLSHYDAYSQFELGKRFGEMILSKCY